MEEKIANLSKFAIFSSEMFGSAGISVAIITSLNLVQRFEMYKMSHHQHIEGFQLEILPRIFRRF